MPRAQGADANAHSSASAAHAVKEHLKNHGRSIDDLHKAVAANVAEGSPKRKHVDELFARYKQVHEWFEHDVYGCVSSDSPSG